MSKEEIKMQLTKCENGHIYNAEKFRSCPHCSKLNLAGKDLSDTFGRNQSDVKTEIAEIAAGAEVAALTNKKVIGMLVVMKGEMKGAGFLLKEGHNSIGRSSNMDVALTAEPTVSRKQHAMIEYVQDRYVVHSIDGNKSVYVNNKLVSDAKELSDRDVIRLGDCRLAFIEAGSIWKAKEE